MEYLTLISLSITFPLIIRTFNVPSQVLSLVQLHSHNSVCDGDLLVSSKMDPSTCPFIHFNKNISLSTCASICPKMDLVCQSILPAMDG